MGSHAVLLSGCLGVTAAVQGELLFTIYDLPFLLPARYQRHRLRAGTRVGAEATEHS